VSNLGKAALEEVYPAKPSESQPQYRSNDGEASKPVHFFCTEKILVSIYIENISNSIFGKKTQNLAEQNGFEFRSEFSMLSSS
jgi:hypothetical protein